MSVNKGPTDAELAQGNGMTESQYLMSANFEEIGETTIDKRSESDSHQLKYNKPVLLNVYRPNPKQIRQQSSGQFQEPFNPRDQELSGWGADDGLDEIQQRLLNMPKPKLTQPQKKPMILKMPSPLPMDSDGYSNKPMSQETTKKYEAKIVLPSVYPGILDQNQNDDYIPRQLIMSDRTLNNSGSGVIQKKGSEGEIYNFSKPQADCPKINKPQGKIYKHSMRESPIKQPPLESQFLELGMHGLPKIKQQRNTIDQSMLSQPLHQDDGGSNPYFRNVSKTSQLHYASQQQQLQHQFEQQKQDQLQAVLGTAQGHYNFIMNYGVKDSTQEKQGTLYQEYMRSIHSYQQSLSPTIDKQKKVKLSLQVSSIPLGPQTEDSRQVNHQRHFSNLVHKHQLLESYKEAFDMIKRVDLPTIFQNGSSLSTIGTGRAFSTRKVSYQSKALGSQQKSPVVDSAIKDITPHPHPQQHMMQRASNLFTRKLRIVGNNSPQNHVEIVGASAVTTVKHQLPPSLNSSIIASPSQ